MAFAAVISLKDTIRRLLNSPRISVVPFTRGILEFAYERVESLQEALRRYDDVRNCSEGVTASDARIREQVRRLEDAIEVHASAQFLEDEDRATFSLNLRHLTQQIHTFAEAAVKMEDEYVTELLKPSDQEQEDAAAAADADADVVVSSVSEMVGLSDQFVELRQMITENVVNFHQFIFAFGIIGMPGIGKTRVAKKLFHDSSVEASFECRAFVTVGRKWGFGEILRAIIARLNPDHNVEIMDRDLVSYLYWNLRGRKFLIILDGITDLYLFSQVQEIIPVEHNGSVVLFTCVGSEDHVTSFFYYPLRFLNEDESWELLRKTVFGDYYPHDQLVKAGKKIAEKCEGLPLLILKVAELLREGDKDLEYWEEVPKKRNPLFEEALDQVYKVLLPSYQFTPQYLQINFLYMGAFRQDHIITNSEFGNLWLAEGFNDIPSFLALHLLALCNFIVVRGSSNMSARAKACTLHVAYRHLTKREAEKNKVFHILDSYQDCLQVEHIEGHRCLVIHENVLFAINEVHDTMASLSTVRSVLCMGPYQQYQVPICSDWGLLRVLNALTIRFYEFPSNLGKLILLRYLSLTCNANLHSSISKLWNLQFLIVHPHLSIKRNLSDSYVPVEIWDLKELLHLQIMGRNLPDPPPHAVLPKLIELLDVGVQSCTKKVLQSVPNLEKLRVQIELGPVAAQNLTFFDHISCLHQLRSFQSVIMNPQLLPEPIIQPPPCLSIPTSGLEKLTLKGFGFPWVEMSKLAKLPNLKKLILQSYAFRGEKWDAKEIRFSELWYLCIEDTDLVQWNADNETFKMLGGLTLKNCYKLREIPLLINVVEIELVDCNPLAEASAKQWDCRSVIATYSWK